MLGSRTARCTQSKAIRLKCSVHRLTSVFVYLVLLAVLEANMHPPFTKAPLGALNFKPIRMALNELLTFVKNNARYF